MLFKLQFALQARFLLNGYEFPDLHQAQYLLRTAKSLAKSSFLQPSSGFPSGSDLFWASPVTHEVYAYFGHDVASHHFTDVATNQGFSLLT